MSTKKWEIQSKFKVESSKLKVDELIQILLENRKITTKKEIDEFLHPKLEDVTVTSVGIDTKHLAKALKRIQKAVDSNEQIIIYGDYDVDGIAASAILWETLRYAQGKLYEKVLPYIPHRIDQGYGLSVKGIEDLIIKSPQTKLIITVDNGIVANDAVDFANTKGIDVIITDHHVASQKLPDAHSIVHTTKLCGTGVAYLLAQEFINQNSELKIQKKEDHLALVALATIADLVPLTGANRTLTKYGLEILRKTKRPGIVALCTDSGIEQDKIDVYDVGHMIAPRLNAMGRLESAMDSLRLLCTKDPIKAQVLADTLGATNKERQHITQIAAQHASTTVRGMQIDEVKLLFISHETYQQGVIGLVAGRLVEEFYRPSIVVSIGEKHSKASARSVHGFNIIEFIRQASEHLVDAGGHPMAAGFTVETEKLPLLQKTLEELAGKHVNAEMLLRTVRVDLELPLSVITFPLYTEIQALAPFGMGNQEPTFMSRNVILSDFRLVGKDKKHVKLVCSDEQKTCVFDGIAFGMGEKTKDLKTGDKIDIVYSIDENTWNGKTTLQLKVKDLKKAD